MKRFCVFACLCLICVVLMADTALAGEVSSAAISLDLAAGSVEIYESEGVTYCVQNEVTQTTTGGVILRQTDSGIIATTNTVTVSGGSCKVTISSLNIKAEEKESPIYVKTGASLDLTLLGSSTVTGGKYCAGIQVPKGASITIGGSGSVTATGGHDGAGIGGGEYGDGGTVTINSGSVTANGGGYPYGGAGIGGGRSGDGGTVTINNGTVTATGGERGAGIGGGDCGDGGTVTINNGTVTATGGESGAGIGGGRLGDGGTITINGGTVTATSSRYGAGIGGGLLGDGGTVTINGGTVTATGGSDGTGIGGSGAGIGGGCQSTGGTVTVNGGTVIAAGYSDGAGVGAGRDGTFDAVTISENATVTNGEGDAPYVAETIFIDAQPTQPIAANAGNIPAAVATAHNHSGLHYQWQVSSDKKYWTDLEDSTTATAQFAMTEELDGAYLRCKLTNGWGNVKYTDAVKIYVLAFAQQPTSVEANLNDMVVFEATSTCANVTYQWQRSYDDGATWSNVDGETFSTLIVNATLAESASKYRCVITATNGDQLASDAVSVNLDLGTLVTYTVQDFWQDADGSGYTVKSQQIFEGLSGEAVTATGVDYDGFVLNREKSTLSGKVAEDSSLVLTRYFDRNTYSITFDTNGGSALPALEALYGAAVEAPGAPTRYGHVFDGWYADKDLTEEYTFDTMPLNGATVYAKWTPVGADRGIEYTINGLAVRDSATYELLEDIPVGQFLVEVSVTNLSATETDTVLLVYYTDEGQMVGMNYMFANTPVGYTAVFGAAVDNSAGNIGIIQAFVLPSLGNPIPLANSAEIK